MSCSVKTLAYIWWKTAMQSTSPCMYECRGAARDLFLISSAHVPQPNTVSQLFHVQQHEYVTCDMICDMWYVHVKNKNSKDKNFGKCQFQHCEMNSTFPLSKVKGFYSYFYSASIKNGTLKLNDEGIKLSNAPENDNNNISDYVKMLPKYNGGVVIVKGWKLWDWLRAVPQKRKQMKLLNDTIQNYSVLIHTYWHPFPRSKFHCINIDTCKMWTYLRITIYCK